MAVAGLRGTGDWGTGERPQNFREMILWRNPNGAAPLLALTSKMRSETTNDPQFHWWEEELTPIRLQVNGVVTTVTYTTITVDNSDAEDLVIGDVLMVEKATVTTYSYELVEVTAVNSATEIEVSRGVADTTAALIPNDAFLLKVGSAFAEGTTSPTASTRNPTKYTNYTQIFKTTYDITGTAEQTYARTGDPIKNDKKRKSFDHSTALEYALLFGHPYETTGSNGKPKRYTGGLMHFLGVHYDATTKPTIATLNSATATEEDFLDNTYQMFDFEDGSSGNERIGLCGNGYLNIFNKMANGASSTRVNYDGIIDVYGMKMARFVIPQGTLLLRSHPLMNVNTRFTNGAFFLSGGNCRYRAMKGRDTRFKDNIQANDADSRKGQWMTEMGAEFHHLRSMKYMAFE